MIELAQKTGAALAANYQQRLLPNFAKVKELMMDRTLGEPVWIKYHVGEVFDWPTVSGFYFNAPGSGRGVLRDRGAHVLDHICWWLGAKPRVSCSQNDSFGGSEAVAYVKFEHNNCVGEVKLSWLSTFPCKFIVEFEHGAIESEIYYPQSVLVKTGVGRQKRVKLKSETYTSLGPKMMNNFIRVILHDEKPLVPGSEVVDSISMTDECYASATQFEMPWYEILEVKK
jgi:predicted dehydrogenase